MYVQVRWIYFPFKCSTHFVRHHSFLTVAMILWKLTLTAPEDVSSERFLDCRKKTLGGDTSQRQVGSVTVLQQTRSQLFLDAAKILKLKIFWNPICAKLQERCSLTSGISLKPAKQAGGTQQFQTWRSFWEDSFYSYSSRGISCGN